MFDGHLPQTRCQAENLLGDRCLLEFRHEGECAFPEGQTLSEEKIEELAGKFREEMDRERGIPARWRWWYGI